MTAHLGDVALRGTPLTLYLVSRNSWSSVCCHVWPVASWGGASTLPLGPTDLPVWLALQAHAMADDQCQQGGETSALLVRSRNRGSDMTEQSKPPSARLSHCLPGRVRLKIGEKSGDARYFDHTAHTLSRAPAVTAVTANPATSSVLVHYRGAFEPVAEFAAKAGLFVLAATQPQTETAAVHPLSLVASAFTALGLVQLGRGRIADNAVEPLWNAYGAAVTLGSPTLSAALVALGAYQLVKGQLLGSASSLLFYAATARHMRKTPSREAAA